VIFKSETFGEFKGSPVIKKATQDVTSKIIEILSEALMRSVFPPILMI